MPTSRIAYFDCATGAAGDMILGALVDAGAPIADLRAALRRLPVKGYRLAARRVTKHGIGATKVDVVLPRPPVRRDPSHASHPHAHAHVGLRDIRALLRDSRLSPGVRERAERVFERLARAEAAIHRIPVERVHFHEVGAVDAIVDVVGSLLALDLLGVQEVFVSPLPLSAGTVRCDHGVLPVPAPATVRLLHGAPFVPSDLRGELITPTAAAIFAAECPRIGVLPAMTLAAAGYGAGTRDLADRPNVLRVLIGEAAPNPARAAAEPVWVIEANLDDATGEIVGYTLEQLLAAGALDAFATPVHMKKGRPGVVVTALAPADRLADLERVLLTETTTFGLRRHPVERSILPRSVVTVRTPYGPIQIKLGARPDGGVQIHPEYEDCRRQATQHKVPLQTVIAAARKAAPTQPRRRR